METFHLSHNSTHPSMSIYLHFQTSSHYFHQYGATFSSIGFLETPTFSTKSKKLLFRCKSITSLLLCKLHYPHLYFPFPHKIEEKNSTTRIDRLPDELLLVIIKKLDVFGIKDIFSFKETSHRHLFHVNKKATFRLLPTSYLRFFTDDSPSVSKGRFMHRFSYSGHASVCVVLVLHLLLQPQPNLETIRDILAKAAKHESNAAKYLEIMLEVLAIKGIPGDQVFSAFSDLFLRHQLANCRRTIMRVDDLHLAREDLTLRSMPFGLGYKFTCPSNAACEGSQRFENIDCHFLVRMKITL